MLLSQGSASTAAAATTAGADSAAEAAAAAPLSLARDLWAFVFGNTIGKAITFLWDFGDVVQNLIDGNFGKAGLGLIRMAVNLAFPNYGYYGGAGYGTRQWGADGSPAPINDLDSVNRLHDLTPIHRNWVRGVWSRPPPGPFGFAYAVLGTVPFWVAGGFQE